MQLAVDVQIPDEFGGLNGEAIYIGILEDSFHPIKSIYIHDYWLCRTNLRLT